MSDLPLVTVLIPARNEEGHIQQCLEAVLAQDYPHDQLEVVLVDGASTDETVALAARVLERGDIAWAIVDNPTATTPSNLNVGLRRSAGEVICRVDARSLIPASYVRLCVDVLCERPEVAVAGGAQVAVASADSSRSVGIARALNNRYAMGGARYRRGATSGQSDTVYLGAFRTEQLSEVGGWDTRMETNQDFDLNRRLARLGTVWFDSRLAVAYVPRERLVDLWRQYRRFGRWKVRYWRATRTGPLARQYMLLLGAPLATIGAVQIFGRMTSARDRALWVGALCASALVVEAKGSGGPDGGLAARIVAVAGMGVVSSAWVSGVWGAILVPPN